jgi:hypothetical protein
LANVQKVEEEDLQKVAETVLGERYAAQKKKVDLSKLNDSEFREILDYLTRQNTFLKPVNSHKNEC